MRDPSDHAGLTILTSWRRHDATVSTHGDIDVCTTGQLSQRLADLLAIGPQRLTIDLTGTRYIDAAGCRALARTALALPPGRTLTLRSPSSIARRLLALTGLDQFCRIEPTSSPHQPHGRRPVPAGPPARPYQRAMNRYSQTARRRAAGCVPKL